MSAYQSIPARAIFNGKSVIVQGVGAKFDGQRQQDATNQEVISDGVLHYRGLPEGDFTISFSSSSTTTTNAHEIEIEFKDVVGVDPNPLAKFVGVLASPQNGSGIGTWEWLNLYKQVYLISLASNMIGREKQSVEGLQSLANEKIVGAVNFLGWSVVWGPVVWKNDPNNQSTGPDHVWFVAKKNELYKGNTIYATSIAGSATVYNYLVNNAGVVQVVDFTTWATNSPPSPTSTTVDSGTYIAYGTAQGVHTLHSYPAPAGTAGAGKTLPEFLKNAERRGPETQFIFTGFSLGGALSPTLALALAKPNADVFKKHDKVLTYPVAGASPGNVHFANLFAKTFPKSSAGPEYRVWNTNIANSLDIVPQAWSTDPAQSQNLDKIPKIYGNNPPLPGVEMAIGIAKDTASKSGIVYIPLQSTPFTPDAVTPPKDVDEFRAIAIQEHTEAYLTYFGVPLSLLQQAGLEGAVEVYQEGYRYPDLVIDI